MVICNLTFCFDWNSVQYCEGVSS